MRAWSKWPLVRAHLCTLAVSVSFNSTWRVPRDAFRYGGLQYGLVLTVAMLGSMPLVLLQLAVGQLSQQDAVGVWKAVPFFKGVGYLRLLVSALGCVYTVIHVALAVSYFLYTLSSSIPFEECTDIQLGENGTLVNAFNASECMSETFMSPVSEHFEYYMSMSLIIVFLWISLPFLLYSPIKLMKRIFYALGPVILVGGVAVVSGIGSSERLASFHHVANWDHLLQPHVWLGAVTQALLSTQVAGGYLISAGDSIYSSTNVQWSAIAIVASNVVASWWGLVFWFAVAGSEAPSDSSAAVLEQIYRATEESALPITWPLVVFAGLFMSGVVTMLTCLFPVYDRLRRACGVRWRVWGATAAACGAAASLASLAGHDDALHALEHVAIPTLVSVATVLELLAFVFIYGWKTLKEDVEFLTGRDLPKSCVLVWFAAPWVVLPLLAWWATVVIIDALWTQPPWSASVFAATTLLIILVIVVFAVVVVARQVQYDIIGKLKSSFRPSRHWGPRDPITHYYWLARREEGERGGLAGAPRSRFRRRRAGQLSGATQRPLPPPTPPPAKDINSNDLKRRSNSDDWIYTVCRRHYLETAFADYIDRTKRSVSLEWGKLPRVKRDSMELNIIKNIRFGPVESVESLSKSATSDIKISVC